MGGTFHDDRSGADSPRTARQFSHDILNQLFIVQGRAEVVLLELDPGHPLRTDIVEIHRACVRAVQLTEEWRTAQPPG
jgi:hypothetical protein